MGRKPGEIGKRCNEKGRQREMKWSNTIATSIKTQSKVRTKTVTLRVISLRLESGRTVDKKIQTETSNKRLETCLSGVEDIELEGRTREDSRYERNHK